MISAKGSTVACQYVWKACAQIRQTADFFFNEASRIGQAGDAKSQHVGKHILHADSGQRFRNEMPKYSST